MEEACKSNFKYVILLSPIPIGVEDTKYVKYIGRYDIVGFGYSEIVKRRKPIHTVLLEGTITSVQKKNTSLNDMLRYGLYSLLNRVDNTYRVYAILGYGSFIPLI